MSWRKCPRCKKDHVFCIDSRPSENLCRRRYRCKKCNGRFTTIEEIVTLRRLKNRQPGEGYSIRKLERDAIMDLITKTLDKAKKRSRA